MNKISATIKYESIGFAFRFDTQIDFNKINPSEHFPFITINNPQISSERGFFTKSFIDHCLSPANIKRKETIVLNAGVGSGKTTAIYDIVLKYAQQPEYIVIVASPYKSLVAKDFQNITDKAKREKPTLKVLHYQQVKESSDGALISYISSDIHVLTINCLLGNPGDDAYEQAFSKKAYMALLKNYCRTHKKQVIIIFDEICRSSAKSLPVKV